MRTPAAGLGSLSHIQTKADKGAG